MRYSVAGSEIPSLIGVGIHYIGSVGWPAGSMSAILKKIARLMGRLGLGPRLVGHI